MGINEQVSTYIQHSDIRAFNSADSIFLMTVEANHFYILWKKSIEIYELTMGYFDPTVMPVINYWGFGYMGKSPRVDLDSTIVDSLMAYIGLDRIKIRGRFFMVGEGGGFYKFLLGVGRGFRFLDF